MLQLLFLLSLAFLTLLQLSLLLLGFHPLPLPLESLLLSLLLSLLSLLTLLTLLALLYMLLTLLPQWMNPLLANVHVPRTPF
mmetsp:Transcript_33970/g.74811  ORF Transcript_33970/g.74811 Transcript_33970/m.74811 type:complete len:82 (+) Transcript_33970:313-558(+)